MLTFFRRLNAAHSHFGLTVLCFLINHFGRKYMTEFVDRTKAFLGVAIEDLRNASPVARTFFLGGAAVIGAHVAGAETIYSNVGIHVFNATDYNPFLAGAA